MRRLTFFIFIIFMLSLLINPITQASPDFNEDVNGKIEASMFVQIKAFEKEADRLIVDMQLMIDAIALKSEEDSQSSQEKLSKIAQLVTIAEDYQSQLKNLILDKKIDIDSQYGKATALMKDIKSAYKDAETLLNN